MFNNDFWDKIRTEKIKSDESVKWNPFGPCMAGYCEKMWLHPTDEKVMFLAPDMHISYGTWDKGNSWQSIKDYDGLGDEMKRVLDIEFSYQNPDFGMAIDWNGWVYKTLDRGKTWTKIKELGKSYKQINEEKENVEIDFEQINSESSLANNNSDGKIDPDSFVGGWYFEQLGSRHSELAVDPNNDNIWFVGAGDFLNVKDYHKSERKPEGTKFKFAEYGHIWKTLDKGETWIKITKGLPKDTDVCKIIVNPMESSQVIMATNRGVYISFDGGESWEEKSANLPNNLPRDLTYFYDKKENKVYLYLIEQTVYIDKFDTVDSKGGIFISEDFGESWKDISGNLRIDMSQLTDELNLMQYYKAISYWFSMTIEEAKGKFTKLPKDILPIFNFIAVNPLDKNEIHIAYNKKHDRTFGPGELWSTFNCGEKWDCTARFGKYWIESFNDEYWTKRDNPIGANMEFAHLQPYMDKCNEPVGNRFVKVGLDGSVYIEVDQQTLISTDKCKTFAQIDDYKNEDGLWIGRGASNLPGRFMLHETGVKGRRLFCTGEHGLWQTVNFRLETDITKIPLQQIDGQNNDDGAHSISTVAVHPKNPDIIYTLISRQEHRGELRRSLDGGKTWKNIAKIFDEDNNPWQTVCTQYSLLIDPITPENMYFCCIYDRISEVGTGLGIPLTKGCYGVLRSFDGGYTWEGANENFPENASVRRLEMHTDNPNILYAALNNVGGGLFVSENKGDSWRKIHIPDIECVNDIAIDKNSKTIYVCSGRPDGEYEKGGVFKSTNNGESWEKIFKAHTIWQVETSPLNQKLIMVVVGAQKSGFLDKFINPGVYLSKNGGETFIKINKGLAQSDKIVDVKFDPYDESLIWAAGWGSGWFCGKIL